MLVNELIRMNRPAVPRRGERSRSLEVAAVGITPCITFCLSAFVRWTRAFSRLFASELSTPRDPRPRIARVRRFHAACIAGFVGADHVAMLLASGALTTTGGRSPSTRTNTEIT